MRTTSCLVVLAILAGVIDVLASDVHQPKPYSHKTSSASGFHSSAHVSFPTSSHHSSSSTHQSSSSTHHSSSSSTHHTSSASNIHTYPTSHHVSSPVKTTEITSRPVTIATSFKVTTRPMTISTSSKVSSVPQVSSASRVSSPSTVKTGPCSSQTVSSLASVLSTYSAAGSFCQSEYPQSTYSTTTSYTFTTYSLTTTVTLCTDAPSGISSVPRTLTTSSRLVLSTLKSSSSTKSSSKASSSASTTKAPKGYRELAARAASDAQQSAYSSLTQLPSNCISSVCSKLAGTVTVTTSYATAVTAFAATSVVPYRQTCGPMDFCDKAASGGPVCRPKPGVNSCTPSTDFRYIPACNSTGGCAGNCFHVPVPANISDNPLDYNADPAAYAIGVCGEDSPYVFRPYFFIAGCRSDEDCGRGEFCGYAGQPGQPFICLQAASETCSGGGGSEPFSKRKSRRESHQEILPFAH